MSVLFSNNAATTLAAGVGDSATSISVVDGSVFPALSGSNYFYLTLEVASNAATKEIVKCTARSGNTLTIVRAQDGTSATTFSTADKAELRLTAAGLNDVADQAVSDSPTFVDVTATSLDISGDIDVDGTTNLDVVDIDGAVDMASTALVTGVLTTTAATVFNGGFASNAASTISLADNGTQLTLISTDADGAVGPVLDLFRNSASPANFDIIGKIVFSGEDDGGNKTDYAHQVAYPQTVTGGSEQGYWELHTLVGGTDRVRIDASATEVSINNVGIDSDFRVESSGNANMLFVDGGNNRVGVGTSAPAQDFHIREDSGDCNLLIDSANGASQIFFGDDESVNIGKIGYNHASNFMEFHTNGSEKFRIASDGAATFSFSVDATNYKINGSQGTDGQVLTSTGSGVAWEDASGGGGGASLYAVETTGASNPTASGTLSIAIGSDAVADGAYGVAIGSGSDAGIHSVSIGRDVNMTEAPSTVAIGKMATVDYAPQSVIIGLNGQLRSYTNNQVAIGTNARTNAEAATALQYSYASGVDSFAAAISTNSSVYGAQGTRSVAIGNLAKASGNDAKCISNSSVASGHNSTVIGGNSGTASAEGSTVLGGSSNVADKDYAIAKGYYGNANGVRGKEAFGNGPGRQRAQYCLAIDTTDATATVMGVFYWAPTLSAANQLVIPNNTVMAFSGLVTCRQQAADGTDSAAFEIKGLLRREGSAGTTTLVSSLVNTISNAQSFGVALSANTTLGSLSITVTGAASHDLRWVAQLDTAESTYA